jgi:hypothetical protein
MMEHGNATSQPLSDEERKVAAMAIWNHEKGLAAAVIIVSWIFKVCLSSQSLHSNPHIEVSEKKS